MIDQTPNVGAAEEPNCLHWCLLDKRHLQVLADRNDVSSYSHTKSSKHVSCVTPVFRDFVDYTICLQSSNADMADCRHS